MRAKCLGFLRYTTVANASKRNVTLLTERYGTVVHFDITHTQPGLACPTSTAIIVVFAECPDKQNAALTADAPS